MLIKIVGISFSLLSSAYCMAINVGDITSIIESKQFMLAKEIENNTDIARFVGLNVFRISSPMDDGQVIPMESKSEILSTPASMVLPGESTELFKIFYQGPNDDIERYYRLSWIDAPVSNSNEGSANKGATATTSAQINTILVVAPRKEKFDYSYANGTIINNGNTSFRAVASGQCIDPSQNKDGNGCRERYYVMPGMSITFKHTDINSERSNVGIWHNNNYMIVAR